MHMHVYIYIHTLTRTPHPEPSQAKPSQVKPSPERCVRMQGSSAVLGRMKCACVRRWSVWSVMLGWVRVYVCMLGVVGMLAGWGGVGEGCRDR
ncbi:predicted protein [Plenodomus lingam JN3]|uniref:Predicted protein n=1 Tax=Leptosphaeria maculans (strain JN3 / isolate v23.1.3 / race Av1-4-5-6-7-8) TaxID=985895 RepID=E4ZUP6_LEPMJ|nr:predicted protein [Plenodomus lingam JN3]CBX95125.1 predicted protein [Plenodomus lingam JN3]